MRGHRQALRQESGSLSWRETIRSHGEEMELKPRKSPQYEWRWRTCERSMVSGRSEVLGQCAPTLNWNRYFKQDGEKFRDYSWQSKVRKPVSSFFKVVVIRDLGKKASGRAEGESMASLPPKEKPDRTQDIQEIPMTRNRRCCTWEGFSV